jgi:DNA-binding transcriptional ArsR family regulator
MEKILNNECPTSLLVSPTSIGEPFFTKSINEIGSPVKTVKTLNAWNNQIHSALAHPLRRRIIQCLQEKGDLSFKELMEYVDIGNHGKLGFHIRALGGLVEHEPSMKRYRLTDRGKLAAELISNVHFTISRGEQVLAHEPIRYVRRLSFGDHALLLYDTGDVKRKITLAFLKAGLPRGEAVVYLVSEHKADS